MGEGYRERCGWVSKLPNVNHAEVGAICPCREEFIKQAGGECVSSHDVPSLNAFDFNRPGPLMFPATFS